MTFGPTDAIFKQGADGRPMAVGRTHRIYRLVPGAVDDFSIPVPPSTAFMSILDSDVALSYEINPTEARGSIEGLDSRRDLAIDDEEPLRPVEPGEFINISAQSGNLGFFTLILEGGPLLPLEATDLLGTDPGP